MAEKSIYWLVSFAILFSMSVVIIAQEGDVQCYSCGYMLTSDGKKVNIPEKYEHIPLCTEDTINNSSDENLKPVGIGGCCVALKLVEVDDSNGGKAEIHRFGAATEEDIPFKDFQCGETAAGYQCKHEHFSGGYYEDDGEICHCFESKCNTHIPDIPDAGLVLLPSAAILFVALLIAQL